MAHRRGRSETQVSNKTLTQLLGCVVNIEGNIGAGKSLTATLLKKYLEEHCNIDAVILEEPINDKLLDLFLNDKPRYAFPFQSIVATQRVVVHEKSRELCKRTPNGKPVVVFVVRGLVGDLAFAAVQIKDKLFTPAEIDTYYSLIGINDASDERVEKEFMRDSTIVMLDCPPKKAFERMRERNRGNEAKSYKIAYFEDLHEAYENSLSHCCDVKRIDWSKDYDLENKTQVESLCLKFIESVPQLHKLVLATNKK